MADEYQWDSFRSTEVLSHNNAAIMDNGSVDGNLLARNLTENHHPADGFYNQSIQSLFLDDEEDPMQKCASNIDLSSPVSRDSLKECHLWGLEQFLSHLVDHGCYLKCTTITGDESYTTSTSSIEWEKKEEPYLSCSMTKSNEEFVDRPCGYSSEIVADEICKERTEEPLPLNCEHGTNHNQRSNDWIEKQGIAIRGLEAMSCRIHQAVEELIGQNNYSVTSTSSYQSTTKLQVFCEQENDDELREGNDMDHSLEDDNDIAKNVSKLIEEQEEAISCSEMIASVMSQALDEFNISKLDSEGNSVISSRGLEWVTYWSDDYQREYYYNIESKQVFWFLPKTVIRNDGDKAADNAYYDDFREIIPKDQLPCTSYYFSHSVDISLALIITLFFKFLAFLFAAEFTRDDSSPSKEYTKDQ